MVLLEYLWKTLFIVIGRIYLFIYFFFFLLNKFLVVMEPGNDYVKCFKNSQAIVVSENQYKSQLHLSCPHNYHILLYQSFKRLYNIFLIFFANNQRHTRWKPFVNVFAYTCLEIAVGGTKTNFWTSTTLADFFGNAVSVKPNDRTRRWRNV
jgi:hypothetical protein